MEERLQNVLSHRGVASRRHAAEMIASGRVTVDGRVVTEPGLRVDPAASIITFICLKSDQVTKCAVAAVKVNRFKWIKKVTR